MKVSVIGLGKLGSPLAAVLASKNYEVIGVDLSEEVVDRVNRGIAPVEEPRLQELMNQGRAKLKATTSYQEAVESSEVTFLIVPTPSNSEGLFSNEYLLKAVTQVGRVLRGKKGYHLVVITSTVTPGSSQGEIKEALELSSQKEVGVDLGLCYNPEFIALGNVVHDMLYPDMILIGESDPRAGALLESIYQRVCEQASPVQRMNLVNAEIAKISINTFVTTKISYANMLGDLCSRIPDADVDVVTQAIGLDSRIGSKYLKAAVAFGGPCFPRDNIALATYAEKCGARADLAIATQNINLYQSDRLFRTIQTHAPSRKIAILGLSYKPGTYVVEESPGISLANRLIKEGYEVFVHDPQALNEAIRYLDKDVRAISSLQQCIDLGNTLVIMVPWPEYREIHPESLSGKTVVDCWRIFGREKREGWIHPGTFYEECCGKK